MRLIDADLLIEEMSKWYWDKERQKATEEDISPMDLFTHLAITTVQKQPSAMNFESVDSIDNDIKSNCKIIEIQHWQLIKWLKELKLYREAEEKGLIKLTSNIDNFIYCPYCGRKLERNEKNNE